MKSVKLLVLQNMRFIQRDSAKPRALELTQEASWRNKTVVPVPLVGNVTAGVPILAVENIEETYPIPLDLIGTEEDVFMLSVKGDSMINAGILDHDYIVVRKQNFANNGDIVVALKIYVLFVCNPKTMRIILSSVTTTFRLSVRLLRSFACYSHSSF